MENQINNQASVEQEDNQAAKKMIGLGDLFKKAFEDYKNNFSKIIIFLIIPIAASLGFSLLSVLLAGGAMGIVHFSDSSAVAGVSMGAAFLLFAVGLVILILINLVAMAGMFVAFRDSQEKLEVKEIFNRAKKNIGGYFWVSLLTGILVMLWSLLLIIPGIIFGIYYTLATWVFFKEGKRGMAAIKRSKELIKDYWWAVFGRLILVVILLLVATSIIQSVLPANSAQFAGNIIGWLFGPFMIAYQYHMYKSLVGIKDGSINNNEDSNIKNKTESVTEEIKEVKERIAENQKNRENVEAEKTKDDKREGSEESLKEKTGAAGEEDAEEKARRKEMGKFTSDI